MKKLILASASPRRKELLAQLGHPFEVDASDVEETLDPTLAPPELAISLAQQKAAAVAKRHSHGIVLGADTLVVLGERIFGKPKNREEAIDMLTQLSGKTHRVLTGFTLIDLSSRQEHSGCIESLVTFKTLSPQEIETYVDTGEPMDKAGAYAIQGHAGAWVDRLEGDRNNVIGLPMEAVKTALEAIADEAE